MTDYHEQLKGLDMAMQALNKGLSISLSALDISKEAIEENQTDENKAKVYSSMLKMDDILEKAKKGVNVDADILEYSKEVKKNFNLDKK